MRATLLTSCGNPPSQDTTRDDRAAVPHYCSAQSNYHQFREPDGAEFDWVGTAPALVLAPDQVPDLLWALARTPDCGLRLPGVSPGLVPV